MNAIVLKNVTKHFKKQTVRREYTTFKTELLRLLKRQRGLLGSTLHIEALKGVDLVIPRGKTVGVIGRNGSGKSTLLKVVTGIYSPSSGTMEVNGRISALLELGAGFHPDFTGRENITINGIILGMTHAQIKSRIDEIIRFAELGDFIDEPVRTYSSGMYMRLAFAVATHVDPDILIIDEILSVGDEHFSKKSLAKMNEFKTSGRTILLVTHDLNTVQNWCDLVAWIDGGKIRQFGPPAEVIAQYRQAVAMAEQQIEEHGTSALSAPGLALPEIPVPVASSEAQVRLSSVTWTLRDGTPIETIPSTAETLIRVTYETLDKATPFGLRLQLFSAQHQLVFEANSLKEAFEIPCSKQGIGDVSVTLPSVPLASGNYVLRCDILTLSGESVGNSLELPMSFSNDISSPGILALRTTWELSSDVRPSAQALAG